MTKTVAGKTKNDSKPVAAAVCNEAELRSRRFAYDPKQGIVCLRDLATDAWLSAHGCRLLTPQEYGEQLAGGSEFRINVVRRQVPTLIGLMHGAMEDALSDISHTDELQRQIDKLRTEARAVARRIVAGLQKESAIDAAVMKLLSAWHGKRKAA